MYLRTRYSNTIAFFGREEDVEICNIVFEYAIDCIDKEVKKLKYKYIKKGLSTKGIENDYALGFIYGLKEKFEEQKRNNQEWGLVLMKDKEVTKAYQEIHFEGAVNTDTKFKGHLEIYFKGHEDGKKFSISDKIMQSDDEVLELEC